MDKSRGIYFLMCLGSAEWVDGDFDLNCAAFLSGSVG